jgi:hypothetical protein
LEFDEIMKVNLILLGLIIAGMAQGLRRTSLFVGVVFGPLWGGAMIYRPLYLYGMSAVLLLVAGVGSDSLFLAFENF